MIAYLEIPYLFSLLERRRNPALVGRPILVSHRREVMDCSPEAVSAGLFPGMPLRHARLTLPEAAVCEYQPDHYRDDLRAALDLCAQFALAVEPVSALANAAFLDLPGPGERPLEDARELAARLRRTSGLASKAGLATSKLVARIVSRPMENALVWVPPGASRTSSRRSPSPVSGRCRRSSWNA